MLNRLIANWVYGGFLAGILLLLLTPILTHSWPVALTATFLCLPVYMLHQYEEHDNDRFRQFVNRKIGKDKEALSTWDVFLINVPGVWGITGISLTLAATLNIGFGLIAVDLVLLNAIIHIVYAIASREYNPGLGTAIALFLPFGGFGMYEIQRNGGGTLPMHMIGLATAGGIHVAIVVHALSGAKESTRREER